MAKDKDNKETNQIVKAAESTLAANTTATNVNIPSFLQGRDLTQDTSLAGMQEYYVMSRVKIISSTAGSELKDKFGEGSVIAWPTGVLIAEKKVPFKFSPLFFWTEFCKWADLDDKDAGTSILARSFDKASDIALRARDMKRRFEGYGGPGKKQEDEEHPKSTGSKYLARYVEHLNFGGYIADENHPLYKAPLCLQFSRGDFGVGKNLLTSVMTRKIPLWSQIFQLVTTFRDKGPKKKFWGMDFANIEGMPHIDPSLATFNEEQFNLLKKNYEERRLAVDMSDGQEADEAAAARQAAMANQEM